MLKINEIFLSIQGESTYSGCPCVMVRLTGCNLRCTYCDTEFAFYEGEERQVEDILMQIEEFRCSLVCITGGEPLMQADVFPLMDASIRRGNTVLLETNGSLSLENVPDKVITIMDIKTPDSGCEGHTLYDNIRFLGKGDEAKFVICSRHDYLWAVRTMRKRHLGSICTVLFSPAWGLLDPGLLANWIIEDRVPVRFQLQLHKMIWPGEKRGV